MLYNPSKSFNALNSVAKRALNALLVYNSVLNSMLLNSGVEKTFGPCTKNQFSIA